MVCNCDCGYYIMVSRVSKTVLWPKIAAAFIHNFLQYQRITTSPRRRSQFKMFCFGFQFLYDALYNVLIGSCILLKLCFGDQRMKKLLHGNALPLSPVLIFNNYGNKIVGLINFTTVFVLCFLVFFFVVVAVSNSSTSCMTWIPK